MKCKTSIIFVVECLNCNQQLQLELPSMEKSFQNGVVIPPSPRLAKDPMTPKPPKSWHTKFGQTDWND